MAQPLHARYHGGTLRTLLADCSPSARPLEPEQ
jgi:hypothetical protein